MCYLKYLSEIHCDIEERLCSNPVPVINKKTVSNLTSDTAFHVVCSSGDSMEFDVMNYIEMHPIAYNY